jgi:hypothetical protein
VKFGGESKYADFSLPAGNNKQDRLLNNLFLWSRVILTKITVAQLVKKFSAFAEPEGSLLYSQQPSTGPYTKSTEYGPYSHTVFLKDQF